MEFKQNCLSKQIIDSLPAIKSIWDLGIKESLFKWMLWIILQRNVNFKKIVNTLFKSSLVDKKQKKIYNLTVTNCRFTIVPRFPGL